MMGNQSVLHFLRWLIMVLLTFNDKRQPDLSHYVMDIHPSIHSSIHHFCFNCHFSIIMVRGCWSPSQQSLGEKQECDEKSYEMEFHFYCLFSYCQRVKIMCTYKWSNTLWRPVTDVLVFCFFFIFSWPVLLPFAFQMKAQCGQPVFWRHFWCAVSPFLLQRKRHSQNMWLPELGFHLKRKGSRTNQEK